MTEDSEFCLTSLRARPNWVQRLLVPYRSRRPAAVPTSAHLRRDLGLGEEPTGHRLG